MTNHQSIFYLGILLLGGCFLFVLCAVRAKQNRKKQNAQFDSSFEASVKMTNEVLGKAGCVLDSSRPEWKMELEQKVVWLCEEGNFDRAMELAKKALNEATASHGMVHLDVADFLNLVAIVYYMQGKYPQAEPIRHQEFEVREKVRGQNHPDLAVSAADIARLYLVQKKFGPAEEYYRKSMAIAEHSEGPDSPYIGMMLKSIAKIYLECGRSAEAVPLYQRALSIFEKKHNSTYPYHADIIGVLYALGEIYSGHGKYSEAEAVYNRALGLLKNGHGPHHLQIGYCLQYIAGVYRKTERIKEAEELDVEAQAMINH